MNKSLLIQNGIAGGIAGTVADGLFNNEDEHHYAKSAFMGTLAGVGATALHQSIPSAAKAPAEHVPTPVANVPPAAPIAPTPQPAPVQPKPAATTPVQQQTAPQQPAAQPKPTAAPIVEQPKPAVVAPQPAAKPIEQPKPKPKPEPEPQPPAKAEATPAPKPIEQPKAVQPVQAEPVQQPAAAPKPEPAPIKITPIEQPKPAAPVREEPAPKTAPVQTTAAPAPQPAPVAKAEPQAAPMKITPEEPKQAEPPKAVVPVKPSEEPKQEFVGPKDKPLSRKLTKTINSVKQAASGVGNGITDAAKRLSATASQLKIPPIELNISGIGQNVLEKGRSVASGLARSAQALSIAAIASMDLAGGHGLVTQALETASHSVQVQASMATSTMTKAVNNITEAVGNYHPMQGVENAVKNTAAIKNPTLGSASLPQAMQSAVAIPKAAQSTVAIPEAVKNTGIYQYADDTARRMVINKLNHNDPFIVIDPRTGSVNTYDAAGNSMDRHSALFGLSTRKTDKGISSLIGTDAEQEFAKIQKKDEEKGFDWMDKKGLRVTDSGIFDYEKRKLSYASKYGSEGLQNINGFGRKNGAKGLGIAIHNVYLGTPSERRPARLASKTIGDNFISYGCINMNPLDLQRKVLPKMNHSVKVAVLPYNRSATTPYLGLSANPMADNTEVAKQISSTMHPSSNFLVADKKDGLMGLYSPKGELMEYHHVAQSTVSLPKVIQPVEEPKTANVELLVGGPYKDKVTGETHPYGHVALVVHGHMPDKTKYSKVYDYGRYGKHSGPYGEGILREWNDPTKYINSENLTGRTTTGFTYPASEQEAQNIIKHFESLKSGSKLLSSGKKGNLVPNNVYKLNHDYDAANSNCVTVSLGGLISGMPKLGNRLNSPAFEQLSTLSKVEQLGMQAAHNTNLLMLPASLKFAATKVGGAKTSMYSASSAKRSTPKLANIPVKPKKSAAKLTTSVNAVKTPNA